jgi:hypothetical protein
MLSPEWATLPGFTPIAINGDYFDITEYRPEERGFSEVKKFI